MGVTRCLLMEITELEQAERDLAFALAQGDGMAEDEAAERIARLKREIEDEEEAADS